MVLMTNPFVDSLVHMYRPKSIALALDIKSKTLFYIAYWVAVKGKGECIRLLYADWQSCTKLYMLIIQCQTILLRIAINTTPRVILGIGQHMELCYPSTNVQGAKHVNNKHMFQTPIHGLGNTSEE